MASIENNILILDSGSRVTLEAIEDLLFNEDLNRKVLIRETVNGKPVVVPLHPETPLDYIKQLIFPGTSGPDIEYYSQYHQGRKTFV